MFGDDAAILGDCDLQLLLLANLVGPLGIALLSPVLDSLIVPFGTSSASIGLMISFFTAPSIVMIPIAGVLADRYGRKSILVAALILFGTAGTAIALTTNFRFVLGLRAIQGIAFGGLTPVIITSIGDLYDGTREASAQGFRFGGSGLTLVLFPLLSGGLVTIAWQYPFLLNIVAIPIGIAILLWFEEPTDGTKSTKSVADRPSYYRSLLQLLGEPRVLAMVVARGLGTVAWVGFLTYNSIVVVQLIGGTPRQAGILVALGSAFLAITASQAGRLTDIFESRLLLLIGANLGIAAGLTLVFLAVGLYIASVGTVLIGMGFGITLSLYRSIITSLAPQSLRAGLVSSSEALGRVMDTVTPIAMGGVIAVATPMTGFTLAVQLAGLAAIVVGVGGGIVALLVVSVSPPVNPEQFDITASR